MCCRESKRIYFIYTRIRSDSAAQCDQLSGGRTRGGITASLHSSHFILLIKIITELKQNKSKSVQSPKKIMWPFLPFKLNLNTSSSKTDKYLIFGENHKQHVNKMKKSPQWTSSLQTCPAVLWTEYHQLTLTWRLIIMHRFRWSSQRSEVTVTWERLSFSSAGWRRGCLRI